MLHCWKIKICLTTKKTSVAYKNCKIFTFFPKLGWLVSHPTQNWHLRHFGSFPSKNCAKSAKIDCQFLWIWLSPRNYLDWILLLWKLENCENSPSFGAKKRRQTLEGLHLLPVGRATYTARGVGPLQDDWKRRFSKSRFCRQALHIGLTVTRRSEFVVHPNTTTWSCHHHRRFDNWLAFPVIF